MLTPAPDVDPTKVFKVPACEGKTGESRDLSYSHLKAVGNGSFGVVFQAKLLDTGELTAIKKVLQDKRFKVGTGECYCCCSCCEAYLKHTSHCYLS